MINLVVGISLIIIQLYSTKSSMWLDAFVLINIMLQGIIVGAKVTEYMSTRGSALTEEEKAFNDV